MTHKSLGQQIICFLIGTVINLALFSLSKYAGFPLWTDFTGSFFITAVCGPIPGISSVIIHTALLALLINGTAALWLLPAMLAVTVIISLFVAKEQFDSVKGYVLCAFCSCAAAFALNFLIFLFCGMTGRYTVYGTAYTALHESIGRLFGSLLLSAGITAAELILSFVILILPLLIMPRKRDGLSFR